MTSSDEAGQESRPSTSHTYDKLPARIERLLTSHVDFVEDFFQRRPYREWRKGTIRTLSCLGGARSGKTTFAAAIVKKLQNEKNAPVWFWFFRRGETVTMVLPEVRRLAADTLVVVDGMDLTRDSADLYAELAQLRLSTIYVSSMIQAVRMNTCYHGPGDPRHIIELYWDCKKCDRRFCQDCIKCHHDVKVQAMPTYLTSLHSKLLPTFVHLQVVDTEARLRIVAQAQGSFVQTRMYAEEWLRYRDPAIFDPHDHILPFQIDFYNSLLHGMSHAGFVALAIVAADLPIRFGELVDAVEVLTDQKMTMSDLLREGRNLIEIDWEEVPFVVASHRDIYTFLQEEAELPEIDMAELCRRGIEHAGPFSNYALRNWSTFGTAEDYLSRFEEFRERTFRALNDDTEAKYYGTCVDHLEAWHGIRISSDVPDQRGNMPIHIAAMRGHAHLLKDQPHHLLDGHNRSPFQVAIEAQQPTVYESLPIEWGLAIKHVPEFAKKRLEAGEAGDVEGLCAAIRSGDHELVSLFKNPNLFADPEVRRLMRQRLPELFPHMQKEMPLFCRQDSGNPESDTLRNQFGETPLWDAVEQGDGPRIERLLQYTDVNLVDNFGRTVVEFAWQERRFHEAFLLIPGSNASHGLLMEMLEYAIHHRLEHSMVKLLIRKGADIFEYARLGLLPSETAKQRGASRDLVELLRVMEENFIKGVGNL